MFSDIVGNAKLHSGAPVAALNAASSPVSLSVNTVELATLTTAKAVPL